MCSSSELTWSAKCDTHFFVIHKWIICCDPALPSSQHIPLVNSCVVVTRRAQSQGRMRNKWGRVWGWVLVSLGVSREYVLQAKKMLIFFFTIM